MKNQSLTPQIVTALLFTVLTAATPAWAADQTATTSATIEETGPTRLSDLGTHINPQIGLSSFEYSSQNNSAQRLTGGATAEFGEGLRRLETGLLLVQGGGRTTLNNGATEDIRSTYLAIPMMAKVRVMQMPAQSWYLKGGVLTAFEVSSSRNGATNNIDLLASFGLAGRLRFTKSADFIVEATYNRGLLEALRTNSGAADYNQGALILAGLSFRL